jgi:hypothetical protein
MEPMYYIGLDVHKRKISYCVKDASGNLYSQGSLPATRLDLDCWMVMLRAIAAAKTYTSGEYRFVGGQLSAKPQ